MSTAVANLLSRSATLAVSVADRERCWTGNVATVSSYALRIAQELKAMGVLPGEPVALRMPNTVEGLAGLLGVLLSGCTGVPIPASSATHETDWILADCGAKVLVTSDECESRTSEISCLVISGQLLRTTNVDKVQSRLARWRAPNSVEPSTPALIAYTAGSEGLPKAAAHSSRTLLAEISQLSGIQARDDRPQVVGAPISHAIGLLSGVLLPLILGRPIHLVNRWDPEIVLREMRIWGASAGSGPPTFLRMLAGSRSFTNEDSELISYVGFGGAPVDESAVAMAEALGASVVRLYGSSEHPSSTGSKHSDPRTARTETDGRALEGVECRVVNEGGGTCADGIEGDLQTRGPDLCEAVKVETDSSYAPYTEDGWYRTGDVATIESGYVRIVGRRSQMIIRGGTNIDPSEIESVIRACCGVAEIVVAGIPDALLGERIALVAEFSADLPGLREIRRRLRSAGVSNYKLPDRVVVVGAIPRLPTLKVDRRRLSELVIDSDSKGAGR